ncbi:MAG: LysM peptidoglycan-binding domain-containing protein [Candidatus Hydrogenedentes bacterium]|nr:LysM peptidoglycan-binding domain-containing protein [Candidatus Hydrogenedentota bacterium]
MKTLKTAAACLVAMTLTILSGCATTSQSARNVEQFDPVPPMAAGAQTLDAVSPRTVTDLLRDADQAFQAANAAQESGDEDAALRQYVRMLELLTEADLDPKIFYALRQEFGNILNTSARNAGLYQPRPHSPLDADAYTPSDYSAFEIPFPLPERVLQEIEEIQTGYPKNFQTFLDRSHKYLPHIKKRFREEGLPEDIAYLALVESGFQPKIVSRAGAGGMWQFMRPTAGRFKLRVDSHVDERYDWQSSTEAAIKYLKVLHDHFDGSWPLAITAYNMGEGGLQRAMESNGGQRDLWALLDTPPAAHRIQTETKKYYPRFIATLLVAQSPERYGFKMNVQPPEDTLQHPVNGFFALSDLDAMMGYPNGTLAALNPALLNETTPPSGSYHVLVPAADRDKFAAVMTNAPRMQYATSTHKVKRGETVTQIATAHGVSASELMRINNIRSARSLRAGQTLKLPGGGSAPTARGGADTPAPAPEPARETVTLAKNTPGPATPAPRVKSTYTVRPGDTLYDIAKAHNVSVTDLQNWNDKGRRARIKVGESLVVGETAAAPAPAPAPVTETAATLAKSEYHVVGPGEYPAKIARDYNVSLKDFLAWNNLGARSTIKVGDRLVVAASGAPSPAAQPVEARSEGIVGTAADVPSLPRKHTVRKGESASIIAQKYGIKVSDFLAWNGLTAKSVLHVGQTYAVHPTEGGAPGKAQPAAKSSNEIVHTVAKGQNPTTIARRYGVKLSDLFKWNNWQKNHVLRVGDKVVIRQG